ncbi:hypothetical protein DW954_12075 [Clostridium sp. AM45-5]|nr:MmgE/PrpD family protein [Clostridium sp. AM45-5]RHS64332.1 hypothetical protein DW954_12075 [Clostridium sp. AM45-5]
MYLTEKFAEFVDDLKFEDLPEEIVSLTKERILDSVGAILAGAANWTYREQFLDMCDKMGTGNVSAFTTGERKYPLARALMIDATSDMRWNWTTDINMPVPMREQR